MNKPLNLLTTLVMVNVLWNTAFASEASFLSESVMRPTLNNKGDHFPDLGPTQEAFYSYCRALDVNPKIEKPVVAIFGGAYGKRAKEVLQQTSRVTVLLNDLDERHLTDIPCNKRLMLAPGTFLDIHKNKIVQDFFNDSPIQFHGVLIANVFHYQTPLEGIQGLRYTADHLVNGCEAFLMTIKGVEKQNSTQIEQSAKGLLALKALNEMGQGSRLSEVCTIADASFEETYIPFVQSLQNNMLYYFNKSYKIPFPGYCSNEEDTLNPLFLSLNNTVGFGQRDKGRLRFFYSKPEEMKRWAEAVGLSCENIQYINVSNSKPYKPYIASPKDARYYSARLKKVSLPNEDQYQTLCRQASMIDMELKTLHKGKIFELVKEAPYFVITDVESQEQFPKFSLEDESKRVDLEEKMRKGDTSVIVELGKLYQTYKLHEKAKDLFHYAADINIEKGQRELDLMKSDKK